MAIFYDKVVGGYQQVATTEDQLYIDKQSEVDALNANLADSDEEKLYQIIYSGAVNNVEDYNKSMQARLDELLDQLDYQNYDSEIKTFQKITGMWMTPKAVESVCGEYDTNVKENMIDGNNTTEWEDRTDHQHEIILKLQDYDKRASKIRFRMGTGLKKQLNNVSVYMAQKTNKLDDNLVVTGFNVPSGTGWHEQDFTTKNTGNYIKIVVPDTQHASNYIQISEVEIWVIPIKE